MSTPINLNKARKARARAEKSARGDANALTFGLNKAERAKAKKENARTARALDAKALDKTGKIKTTNPKTD